MGVSGGSSEIQAHTLRSELAQFCLPSARREGVNQRLAWVCSLCLTYLIIGGIGIEPPQPRVREVAPLEQPVVQVIEPVQQEVQPEATAEEVEEQPEDISDAPAIVAVTLDSPSVVFSVPTVGNVLVGQSMASAPPLKPMQIPTAPVQPRQVFNLRFTGRGGSYPYPTYPRWAEAQRVGGTVILLIEVDDRGNITDVQVEQSCGHQRLDGETVDHVRRRFTFPSGETARTYRLAVQYDPPQ